MDEEVFDVNVLDGEEMFVAEQEVADNKENAAGNVVSTAGNATTVSFATTTTATITIVDDITLAQAHMEIKSTKPKEKRVVIQELGESTKIISSQLSSQQSQDKENAKKQKVEDDKETAELKQCLEILLDKEEVTIDAIPLAIKSPSIVGWKIYKEGRKSYYQIMRADGKYQTYMIFSHLLKSFDRQDLKYLYKLVKAKYDSTRPMEDLDFLLWGDLKTMFEPHVEDKV
ncbi:hypothetical protein Tco_0520050 [Tanacetum coccineum]